MEDTRFDAITRGLSGGATRRGAIGLTLSGLLAALGRSESAEAAKKCKPKCKICQQCKNGKCKPKSSDPNCVGDCKQCRNGKCANKRNGASCENGEGICRDGECVCANGEYACNGRICCENGDACLGEGPATSCGACAAGDNFCTATEPTFCGVLNEEAGCACFTSKQGQPACSSGDGDCVACTEDSECTTRLGEPAICVSTGGICQCQNGATSSCIVAACKFQDSGSNRKAAGGIRIRGPQRSGLR